MVTTAPDGMVQTKLEVVEAEIPDANNNIASATLFISRNRYICGGIKSLDVVLASLSVLKINRRRQWCGYEAQTGLETIVPNFSQ